MGAGLRAGLPAVAGQKHRRVKRYDEKMTIKEQESNYCCSGHNFEIINKLSDMSAVCLDIKHRFLFFFFFKVHPPLFENIYFIYIPLITY